MPFGVNGDSFDHYFIAIPLAISGFWAHACRAMNEPPKSCILVVDDQDFIRAMIAMRLEMKGYRSLQAKDGEEAYRLIQGHHPDIVICDILMPGGDGITFCRRLRAEGNNTPLLFLTAKGQPENVVEGLSFGADDYLVKPFDITVLEARVATLLRRHPVKSPQAAA